MMTKEAEEVMKRGRGGREEGVRRGRDELTTKAKTKEKERDGKQKNRK